MMGNELPRKSQLFFCGGGGGEGVQKEVFPTALIKTLFDLCTTGLLKLKEN